MRKPTAVALPPTLVRLLKRLRFGSAVVCGMSHSVRRKAFDPFFTTRRDQGSTGLGRHIVYSIVTNCLGGRLNLDSEPGKGTKIQLLLPRVAPAG
jgi:signal transduction histidine kinase